jgi:hypothetical protein
VVQPKSRNVGSWRPQLMSAVPPLLKHKRTYHCIVALCTGVGAMGLSGWRRCPLVAKISLALVQPSLLIRYGQRIQVLRTQPRCRADELRHRAIVGEFIPRDSSLQLGSLIHDPAASLNSERLDPSEAKS